MSSTIMPTRALLLLALIFFLTLAADFRLEHARQKRQVTNGISCTPLNVINGMVNYLQTNPISLYAQGTTAILQCNMGFTSSGSTNSICSNGMWSPTLGTCIQSLGGGSTAFPSSPSFGLQNGATCLPLLAPLNARLQYSTNSLTGPYPSGTTVQMLCNSGFTPSGTQNSVCQSSVWNPSILGSCISGGFGGTTPGFLGGGSNGMLCPAVLAPLNGQIQYNGIPSNGLYSSGSSATLICNAGTFVSGSSTSTCSNGMWTPPFGMCTASSTGVTGGNLIGFGTGTQCLFPMPAPLGGSVTYSSGSPSGPYSEGASATLLCNGGMPTGTTVAVCQSGQWQPSFFTGCSNTGGFGTTGFGNTGFGNTGFGNTGFGNSLGTTFPVGQCVTPIPSVLGGTINYSQGGQFGPFPQSTFATLQCLNGQQASGSNSASCTSGFWSPATLGPCGLNTGFLGSTAAGIGTGISNGMNNLANGLSNTFNNMPTSCLMGLLPPLNGRITYSTAATLGPYPSGTIATLICNPGFMASGQTSAFCQNGVFNPSSLGPCNLTPGYSPSTSSTNSFGNSSATNCYDMPTPQSGQISYSPAGKAPYPIGSLATLMCQGSMAAAASCTTGGWSPSQLTGCGSSQGKAIQIAFYQTLEKFMKATVSQLYDF